MQKKQALYGLTAFYLHLGRYELPRPFLLPVQELWHQNPLELHLREYDQKPWYSKTFFKKTIIVNGLHA